MTECCSALNMEYASERRGFEIDTNGKLGEDLKQTNHRIEARDYLQSAALMYPLMIWADAVDSC